MWGIASHRRKRGKCMNELYEAIEKKIKDAGSVSYTHLPQQDRFDPERIHFMTPEE